MWVIDNIFFQWEYIKLKNAVNYIRRWDVSAACSIFRSLDRIWSAFDSWTTKLLNSNNQIAISELDCCFKGSKLRCNLDCYAYEIRTIWYSSSIEKVALSKNWTQQLKGPIYRSIIACFPFQSWQILYILQDARS